MTNEEIYLKIKEEILFEIGDKDYSKAIVSFDYFGNSGEIDCILLNPPASDESNLEYFKKLKLCMESYDLPVPTTV